MKSILLLMLVMAMGLTANASNDKTMSEMPTTSESSYSPQVCQFSLTSYTGTISSGGYTDSFQVGVSCPQDTDARATVVVYIDDQPVASKVVVVPAGRDYSASTSIKVSGYAGKRYRLLVQ